jgi:DnaJ-class molecular chaperone
MLSSSQQRALDRLITLGATIDGSFTADELRSAFRALARQYHPDRHPMATAAQRAQLSSVFTELRQAYEDLQAAAPAAA